MKSKSFSVKELIEVESNETLCESSNRIANSNIIPKKIKDILDIRGDDDNPREFHYIFYNYLSRNKDECERKYNHQIDVFNISPITGVNTSLPMMLDKNLSWNNLLDQF